MRNQELSRQLQSLNNLFDRTTQATNGDAEMQAHWARYLCVLCAGFLENAIGELYSEFVRNAASEPVAKYASAMLGKIQNPNATRFIETAKMFKPEWGEELEVFVEDGGRKDAINSIMNNRHTIAHGKSLSRSSDITVARLKQYFRAAIDVIEYIERQCGS